jgi:hypothetical protein
MGFNAETSSIICSCGCFKMKDESTADRRRRLEEGEGDNFDEIGDAFVRGIAVFSAGATLEELLQQIFVLTILGSIFLVYFYIVAKSDFIDRRHHHQRRKLLLESSFVQDAIRAMKENFLQQEVRKAAMTTSDPDSFLAIEEIYTPSEANSKSVLDKEEIFQALLVFTDKSSFSALGDETNEGSEGGHSAPSSKYTSKFLGRGKRSANSSMNGGSRSSETEENSFGDEDDFNILRYLGGRGSNSSLTRRTIASPTGKSISNGIKVDRNSKFEYQDMESGLSISPSLSLSPHYFN